MQEEVDISELPIEVLIHIIEYLKMKELAAFSSTSSHFNTVCSFVKDDMFLPATIIKRAWSRHFHKRCKRYLHNINPGLWKVMEVHLHRSKTQLSHSNSVNVDGDVGECSAISSTSITGGTIEYHHHLLMGGKTSPQNVRLCSYTRCCALYQARRFPYCAGCRRWLSGTHDARLKFKSALPSHYILLQNECFILFFDSPSCLEIFKGEHPDLSPLLQRIT
jgi:hypothetical protein